MNDIDYLIQLSTELRGAINANYMPEVDRVAKAMADQIDAMKEGRSLAPADDEPVAIGKVMDVEEPVPPQEPTPPAG